MFEVNRKKASAIEGPFEQSFFVLLRLSRAISNNKIFFKQTVLWTCNAHSTVNEGCLVIN